MELIFGSELNPLVGPRNSGYEVKYVLCAWILEKKDDRAYLLAGDNTLKNSIIAEGIMNIVHAARADTEIERRGGRQETETEMEMERRRPKKNSEEQKQER
ncbi:hypothetical protein OIU78_022011 [Salix suchowensis]|nr:hypothetical protein OIU78_022011 [Salix suchowensis]